MDAYKLWFKKNLLPKSHFKTRLNEWILFANGKGFKYWLTLQIGFVYMAYLIMFVRVILYFFGFSI